LNLYFDNAATSHPKPEEVYQACDQALRAGGNPGRGAHSLSFAAATLQFESRHEIARYLGIQDSSRLIFTSGCTASINLVLNGMVGAGRLKAGDTVLTSAFEHNAVMRPLKSLAESLPLNLVVVPALKAIAEAGAVASSSGASHFAALVDLAQLDVLLLQHKPALCIFTRASNVTGQILDLDAIAALVSRHGTPLLIDAAQSAGIVQECLEGDLAREKSDLHNSSVSFWVASGHKSMLGPPGIGLLYVRQGELLNPPYRGGTGSRSESFSMPEALPDRLEPGSPAVHLACGVAAGLRYLRSLSSGFDSVRQHENILSLRFLHGLAVIDQADSRWGKIELVGRPCWNLNLPAEDQRQLIEDFLPVFSLRFVSGSREQHVESKVIEKLTPDKVAQYLDDEFGMATRPGLHCALLTHQTLGTVDHGLLRVSFGHGNSEDDVDSLLAALESVWDLGS
jgi:cysteine desulfurase/selenocysteine lyase